MEYDDLSWLTQRSPDPQPNFSLLSDSEDDITVDDNDSGFNSKKHSSGNVSIEDFVPGNFKTSTQIYDGVFAEDISSDDDLDNM